MTEKAKLPMGIEDFEEMRSMDYYYIDKTGLIRTLLENPGKVTLFTRPRRFGKTLNMSMLELKYVENAVFEDGCREALRQIRDKNYEEALIDDGMTTIRKYGIACYKKRCRVVSE